jgi:hypothetical protein
MKSQADGFVVPANAGIQNLGKACLDAAFAGMTGDGSRLTAAARERFLDFAKNRLPLFRGAL